MIMRLLSNGEVVKMRHCYEKKKAWYHYYLILNLLHVCILSKGECGVCINIVVLQSYLSNLINL